MFPSKFNDEVVIVSHRSRPQKRSSIFDDFARVQRHSFDVVIFSNVVKDAVRVAWPLQSSGGKLPPEQIAKWLDDRRLYWSCFCGITAPIGVHFPCQFVLSVSGDILVFCYHKPSACKFFINLTSVCKTTDLVSPYASVQPVVGRPSVPELCGSLLTEFLLKKYQSTGIAPYFQGYCGDFNSGFKQMITQDPQLSTLGKTAIRRKPRHFVSPPDDISPDNDDTHTLVEYQHEILVTLMEGNGVAESHWDGLVTKCDSCQYFYLSATLESHTGNCSYSEDL